MRNVVAATLVSMPATVLVFSSSTNQPCISRPGTNVAPGLSLATASFLGSSGAGGGAGGAGSAGAAAGSAGGASLEAGAGWALAGAANATSDRRETNDRCISQAVIGRRRRRFETLASQSSRLRIFRAQNASVAVAQLD